MPRQLHAGFVIDMMQAPKFRTRAGRSSDETFLNALNRRYALLQGRYEVIEQECEWVLGGAHALIEAQDRVESEKVLMRRVLDAMEIVARDVEPEWSPRLAPPIYPKRRDAATGRMARTGLAVLRDAGVPMTVRAVSREVAKRLDLPPEERSVARVDRTLFAAFDKKVGTTLGVIEGSPKKYYVMEAPSWRGRGQDRRSPGAASIPSIPAKQASAPPR